MSEAAMPNCCVCGKFCRWDSDSSTPFGHAEILEPPDEVFYCDDCAAKEEEDHVARGWVPNDWRKANWQRRAAARLGLREVRPSEGAAWTLWAKPQGVSDE